MITVTANAISHSRACPWPVSLNRLLLWLGWDVETASLSILCGDAGGPFRPYGGSLLSWQKEPKPLAPAYGPTLRSGSPRSGTFRGHSAYDLLRQVYGSRSSATPKVLRTGPYRHLRSAS